MPSASPFNPPIQYDRLWMVIGFAVLAAIPLCFVAAWWLTRRRPFKSLDSLQPLAPGSELDRLKAKYLALIEECYQSYLKHEIGLRALHRGLSMAARYFVYEARHFPAPRLTLADITRAPYPTLTAFIKELYPEEFAGIERGEAAASVAAAKGFITQWL